MIKVDNNKYENIEQVGFKISHLSFFKGLTPNNVIAENVDGLSVLNIYTEGNQIKIQAKKPKKRIFFNFNTSTELSVIYTAYQDAGTWKIVKERG